MVSIKPLDPQVKEGLSKIVNTTEKRVKKEIKDALLKKIKAEKRASLTDERVIAIVNSVLP